MIGIYVMKELRLVSKVKLIRYLLEVSLKKPFFSKSLKVFPSILKNSSEVSNTLIISTHVKIIFFKNNMRNCTYFKRNLVGKKSLDEKMTNC